MVIENSRCDRLFFVFDGDAAEGADCVDINSVFAFFGRIFAIVGKTTENETGFELDYDVVWNDDVDTAEEDEGFNDGVFSEFAVRVGLVLLKSSYMEFDYLALVFDRVERLARREEYYIRMAIAWLVAECFIKFPEETLAYLKVSRLPKWTYNKTISKICDSYRVDEDTKKMLRKMRK